ncbi:MAG: CdaR family protein [Deinococcales bacterium]
MTAVRGFGQGLKGLFQNLWQRLSYNWNAKLGSALLAILLWSMISSSQSLTTQRALTVNLNVLEPQGLAVKTITTGVPETVEVLVSGPSNRINSLKAEQFDAFLDLRDSRGEFKETVYVIPPQGINLQRIMPRDIIGKITLVERSVLPVHVSFLELDVSEESDDVLHHAAVSPKSLQAEGPASDISQAVAAVAYIDLNKAESKARVYALNQQGIILPNVQLTPSEVDISLNQTPIYMIKTIPLIMPRLTLPNLDAEVSLSQTSVQVLGKNSILSRIKTLPVALPNLPQEAGSYELKLNISLPEGAELREEVYATINLRPKNPSPSPQP